MLTVLFNGSPRKKGNTFIMLSNLMEGLNENGIETELIQIDPDVTGCLSCEACRTLKQDQCFQKTDKLINDYYQKLLSADCIVLGSPSYAGSCSATMNAFLEKIIYFSRAGTIRAGKHHSFRHKLGVSLVSTRRSGALQAIHDMDALFAHTQMYMPCSGTWPVCVGNNDMKIGAANFDKIGLETLKILANNISFLLKKINNFKMQNGE